MSVITEEQRIALERSPRYQDVAQQYVKFIAQYYVNENGTAGSTGGLPTPVDWARQRFIAAGIVLHPQSQNYPEWAAQMQMRLKGQDVWVEVLDPDPIPSDAVTLQLSVDATITAMIDSAKFEELSKEVFAIRGTRIEF